MTLSRSFIQHFNDRIQDVLVEGEFVMIGLHHWIPQPIAHRIAAGKSELVEILHIEERNRADFVCELVCYDS
jgi:hypothetical protein